MSEWVCIVRLEHPDDPGAELVDMVKQRFGQDAKTTTALAIVYDDSRNVPVLRGRPGFVAEHEHRGLRRKYGR